MNSIPISSTPVEISLRATHQIRQGYEWIFSNEFLMNIKSWEPGSWCWFAHKGTIVGTGYLNSHSLIAGRLVSFQREDNVHSLLMQRLEQAFTRRLSLIKQGSARLVFSESDLLPGLMVDFYSGVLVVQSNTAGMDAALPILEAGIPAVFENVFHQPLKGMVVKADSSIRSLEGVAMFTKVVQGEESALRKGMFQENGVTYAADFVDGQKTGFFLDQRENRSFLGEWTKTHPGGRVLDLFSYSGGWGLRALKEGAVFVRFVDQSKEALSQAKEGLGLNSLRADKADYVVSDVFDYLEKDKDLYDVVVSDPPAFVKSKKALPQAVKAYEKLARLCWKRVKPGGVLLSSSCSYHLWEPDFYELLKNAVGKENGRAVVVHRGMQAGDHPVLLSMSETQYLKCIGLQKL